MILIDFFFPFSFSRDFFSPFFSTYFSPLPIDRVLPGRLCVCLTLRVRVCTASIRRPRLPNEISDSFQDFMSQVEELDNLEEFQMDLNTMGVIPAGMTHFKS
jgi:hypothetical protein